jgi:hypothetical protein
MLRDEIRKKNINLKEHKKIKIKKTIKKPNLTKRVDP